MDIQGRKRRVWFGVLALGFLCLPLSAQSVKVDYTRVNRDIQDLETAINAAVLTIFPGPFGVVQKPRGYYVQGYGYMFNFLVNFSRGQVRSTPFGTIRDPDISPDQKNQRVAELKDKLMRIFLKEGRGIAQIQKGESIAITAFLDESDPTSRDGNAHKTLIMSVLKSDLDDVATRQDPLNELRLRVKIVEY